VGSVYLRDRIHLAIMFINISGCLFTWRLPKYNEAMLYILLLLLLLLLWSPFVCRKYLQSTYNGKVAYSRDNAYIPMTIMCHGLPTLCPILVGITFVLVLSHFVGMLFRFLRTLQNFSWFTYVLVLGFDRSTNIRCSLFDTKHWIWCHQSWFVLLNTCCKPPV
jgi:hypothetical protein